MIQRNIRYMFKHTRILRAFGLAALMAALLVALSGCGLSPSANQGATGDTSKAISYGTVYGTVRDAKTTARIPGVSVSTAGKTVVTDSYGRFTITGVPKGTQGISFVKTGYVAFSRTYTLTYSYVQLKIAYLNPQTPAPAPVPAPTPTPVPTPTPTPTPVPVPSGFQLTAQEQEMVNLVNTARTAEGLAPLQVDQKLTEVARSHSQEMIDMNYFSHTSPVSGSPFDRLKAVGVTCMYAGENIAGNQTVQAAHDSLMASPGHKANIMNTNFTKVGIGIRAGGLYGLYFTQMFIG